MGGTEIQISILSSKVTQDRHQSLLGWINRALTGPLHAQGAHRSILHVREPPVLVLVAALGTGEKLWCLSSPGLHQCLRDC
jgi:hypothetical protein